MGSWVAGTRTRLELDCRHPSVVPSRRLDCEAYQAVEARAGWQQAAATRLPCLDEEYFEWLDLLKAVDAAKHLHHSQRLVVVEAGAAHGPWAARAWRANQLLHRRPMHLVLVEPHPVSVSEAYDHLAANLVELSNLTIWRAGLSPTAGAANFSTRSCSLTTGHAPPLVTPPSSEHGEDASARARMPVADGGEEGRAHGTGAPDGGPDVRSAEQKEGAGGTLGVQDSGDGVVKVEMVRLEDVLGPFELVHLLGATTPYSSLQLLRHTSFFRAPPSLHILPPYLCTHPLPHILPPYRSLVALSPLRHTRTANMTESRAHCLMCESIHE